MIYTKEKLIEVLENSDVIIKMEGGYIINAVFLKSIKAKKRNKYCQNYPDEFKGLSDVLVYKRFTEECEVPIMAKGDITYFVRTETKESVRKLKSILQNPDIDYCRLRDVCKGFYNTATALPGFAKFIINNTWETIYNDTTEETASKRDFKGTI